MTKDEIIQTARQIIPNEDGEELMFPFLLQIADEPLSEEESIVDFVPWSEREENNE